MIGLGENMKENIDIDRKIINYIKSLGIDMINSANSGHPGIVLGAAPIIYTLYAKHMNISLADSNWINRDRFVLSAGHGSALLYATLYLAGYNISLDDLKNFRRHGFKTPGHPENYLTPGVDVSTGPLGQGIATAVGMALASKILENRHKLNDRDKVFDYKVYVLCSDGDLMEGISYEAASLAGTMNLDNLIILYDSNDISLDGSTNNAFTENVRDRFKAMNFDVFYVKDGNDISEIDRAIARAKASSKPSFIEIKTIIGQGTSLAGTKEVHGSPLSEHDIKQVKSTLEIHESPFVVPEYIMNNFRGILTKRSHENYIKWVNTYNKYISLKFQNNSDLFHQEINNQISANVNKLDWQLSLDLKEELRESNGKIMLRLLKEDIDLIGGSADLASSTKTYLHHYPDITKDNYNGRNIWYGVREHAMGAITNGLALSGFRPFCSTFLVFADYLKPSIRMAAIMKIPSIFIFTHDSISIGPDGPTHQPIEQLAMLRSIPNLQVFRPADARELIGCWHVILNIKLPSSLILSRNKVDLLENSNNESVLKGAYIIQSEKKKIDAIIIATGSEVQTAIHIANDLYREKEIDIRVVSMPIMSLFLLQTKEYQEQILPLGYKKIVIEAGSSYGWHRFVYDDKYLITVNKFGVSGTKDEVLDYFDFSYEKIKNKILKLF